jgi:serine O-acetyltransferase
MERRGTGKVASLHPTLRPHTPGDVAVSQAIVLRIGRPMSDEVNTKAGLIELLRADWATITSRTPNPLGFLYPQFFAVAAYRVSNALWRRNRNGLSRLAMVIGQMLTGAEISGAATIGPGLRISHTAGIVVGNDVVAGKNLHLYAGALLGNHRGRPPTLGDDVRICSKATVIGPIHVGDGAIVGPNALVMEDVPAGATVHAPVAVVK